jgi:putative two-component system response regulator
VSNDDSKSRKVLIVEDNADIRILLKKALKMENFDVLVADDGASAFQVLGENVELALILLDLSMPQMSGGDFIQALRRLPQYAKTKILLVSGWDDLATKARELGADGFIRKPVDLANLYAEIERHI